MSSANILLYLSETTTLIRSLETKIDMKNKQNSNVINNLINAGKKYMEDIIKLQQQKDLLEKQKKKLRHEYTEIRLKFANLEASHVNVKDAKLVNDLIIENNRLNKRIEELN